MTTAPVRWGVLSTARIADTVLAATSGPGQARFVAVASRDAGRASGFARAHGLPRAVASYDELLACDEVDAVYVALPVAMHADWTIRALEAGKHVLCEKPIVTGEAEAEACVAAAERAGRLCVEG